MTNQRGVALILVLLVLSFLSIIGLGLSLVVFMDRLAAGNIRGSIAMLYAADAGVELAARDLALADWGAALIGLEQGSLTDGAPGGAKPIPNGGEVNLSAATNLLNCGRATACSAAQMDANTPERPWGANNPRWQVYAFGPLTALRALARPAPGYLVVWVADDTRETDGDPAADAVGADEAGRGILRVRAEAFGPLGARRAIEAEVARVCTDGPAGETCRPGVRVQSWQEVRQVVP